MSEDSGLSKVLEMFSYLRLLNCQQGGKLSGSEHKRLNGTLQKQFFSLIRWQSTVVYCRRLMYTPSQPCLFIFRRYNYPWDFCCHSFGCGSYFTSIRNSLSRFGLFVYTGHYNKQAKIKPSRSIDQKKLYCHFYVVLICRFLCQFGAERRQNTKESLVQDI